MALKDYIRDFIKLIYPDNCPACGRILLENDNFLCTKCRFDLPLTNFHLEKDNIVEQIFWGRTTIERATSLLFFQKKSRYQKLIHQLKYKGKKEIGFELGVLLGSQLKKSDWIKNIDYIIPVPLHPKRQKKRGYNQSEWIGKGLEEQLGIPQITDCLVRTKHTETQTKKSKAERWENVSSIFTVQNESFITNKSILLIDDVLTTGATIESCAQTILNEKKGGKVYIATIGYAKA